MSYTAPTIDSTGVHIPAYQDIRDDMVALAKTIFGADIYLGNDSQDYQFISAVALKMYDVCQFAAMVYNNQAPSTAVGVGLDMRIKLNGIARNLATYSTVPITLTGTAGAPITNGLVQDINGYQWAIPPTQIGAGGTVAVTATCTQAGAINAGTGEITTIVTPMYGWTSVTNTGPALPGVEVETDSQVRARQAVSTAQPSLTVLEGTKGAIADVDGVTRHEVYENDTNDVDANGIAPHSIAAVVEGGTDAQVAAAIFKKKGPGCGTVGTTAVALTDRWEQITTINFARPTYKDIDVALTVHALDGYTTATTAAIKAALDAYMDSLKIGADLSVSVLWGIALSVMGDLRKPIFSITALTACLHGGTPGTTDIAIGYNEVVRGNASYITVTVT